MLLARYGQRDKNVSLLVPTPSRPYSPGTESLSGPDLSGEQQTPCHTQATRSHTHMPLTAYFPFGSAGDVVRSEYGFSNVKDVLLGKTDKLEKSENYDRFEMENIISWWKKKATKRYDNVVADGRVRKELEVWNQNTMDKIDIIR